MDISTIKLNDNTVYNIKDSVAREEINKQTTITTKTASGNPLIIDDAAEIDAIDVIATFKPIQDFNGYSKPWYGGNGKNLLENIITSDTYNGITYAVNEQGVMTLTGTTSDVAQKTVNQISLDAGTYILNGMAAGGGTNTRMLYVSCNGSIIARDTGVGATFTLSETSTISVLCWINNGVTVDNIEVKPMICLASETDTSFAPYRNICPINGHTQITITNEGKNLYNEDIAEYSSINSRYNIDTGEIETSNGRVCSQLYVEISPNTDYTFSYTKEATTWTEIRVCYYDASQNFISAEDIFPLTKDTGYFSASFTTISNAKYIRFSFSTGHIDIQVEKGNVATSYEKYRATDIYTVDFSEDTGVVYDGEYNLLSGVLTKYWDESIVSKNMTLSQSEDDCINARIATSSVWNVPHILLSDQFVGRSRGNQTTILAGQACLNTNSQYVYFKFASNKTTDEFKAELANISIQLILKYRYPYVYNTTSQAIKLHKGTNIISSSTNGELSITYKTDTIAQVIENIPRFNHNSICRDGVELNKDFGGKYSIAQILNMVKNGKFNDIYIGDTITVTINTSIGGEENVELLVAGINSFMGQVGQIPEGSTSYLPDDIKDNYIALIPKDCLKTTAAMNTTATTVGGYHNTEMAQTTLPIYLEAFEEIFNKTNILIPYNHICNSVNFNQEGCMDSNYYESGDIRSFNIEDYESHNNNHIFKLQLLTEREIIGTSLYNYSANGCNFLGLRQQLPIFKLRPDLIKSGRGYQKSESDWVNYWLQDVVNSTNFACISSSGLDYWSANDNEDMGIRPLFYIG